MEPRFLLDGNLGRLAKWIRIIGYDAVYCRGNADMHFIRTAEKEQRIALVRKRNLAGLSQTGRVVIVEADRLPDQIDEILSKLELHPDPARRMTRCLLCNALLTSVSREEAGDAVPDYIQEKYDGFRKCPLCGRIYWRGTHVSNIDKFLRLRSPFDRPGSSPLHD
jgi:uncharacterized protein